jgi:hypothetical protein
MFQTLSLTRKEERDIAARRAEQIREGVIPADQVYDRCFVLFQSAAALPYCLMCIMTLVRCEHAETAWLTAATPEHQTQITATPSNTRATCLAFQR